MWILLGSGLALGLLWLSRSFHPDATLGTVSSEWLAEYRQNHES